MSNSIYGPWSNPPGCISSSDCTALLPNGGPVDCYGGLAPNSSFAGGCACSSLYGLGGANCLEPTTATPAVLTCFLIVAIIDTLIILRFTPTLLRVIIHPTIWKMHAAGTTFFFTWISATSCIVFQWLNVGLLESYSSYLYMVSSIIDDISVIFLAIAVLNLVGAFLEMSYSVKIIQNIERYRIRIFVLIFLLACLIIFTYLFTPRIVSTSIGFVVVVFLAFAGISGPIILYTRTAKTMVQNGQGKKLKNSEICWTITLDLMECGKKQKIFDLLGISQQSESSSNHSKSSRESKVEYLDVNQNIRGTIASRAATRTELKTIKFLTRALQMGVWLGYSLLVFLIATGLVIGFETYFDVHSTFRISAILNMIQNIGFGFALYQILWFLDDGFQKMLVQTKRLSKFDSKEFHGSKELYGSKEHGSRENVAITNHVQGNPANPIAVNEAQNIRS